MTIKPRKSPPEAAPRKAGRPSRDEELKRAIVETGVDPVLVDPRRILASIAIDTGAPAGARVAAAKALLVSAGALSAAAEAGDDPELDELSRRAIEILNRRPN